MVRQASGANAKTLFGWENGYKTDYSDGSKKVRRLPFNTNEVMLEQPMNQPGTIRGDRNPTQPFLGNKDASGPMVVPVDQISIGFWLAAMFGKPTTSTASTGSDKKVAATITIADGVGTFSVAQTGGIAVGDMITYDTTSYCWIKQVNSTTEVVVVDQYGLDAVSNASAKTVNAINKRTYDHVFQIDPTAELPSFVLERSYMDLTIPYFEKLIGCKLNGMSITTDAAGNELVANLNIIAADIEESSDVNAGGTIAISSGTATMSVSQADAAIGDAVLYNDGTEVQTVFLTAGSGTSWTVKTTRGGSTNPDDVSAKTIIAIINGGYFDGHADDAAMEESLDRFEMTDAGVTEGGSTSNVMKSITFDFGNNLDGDGYTIGGGGIRRAIPEGIASVAVNITAVFEDDSLLAKANARTETEAVLTFTHPTTSNTLVIDVPEMNYSKTSVGVSGPAGIPINMNAVGYYQDSDDESSVVVTLSNQRASYAL